jgi:hypothetical protein
MPVTESRKARRLAPGAAALALASALAVAGPAPASAAGTTPEHENLRSTIEITRANPCNGELLEGTQTLIENFTILTDSSGQRHAMSTTITTGQLQGTFGNSYTFSNTFHSSALFDGAPIIVSEPVDTKVISQGDAPNFVLHQTIHTTINANGELTANISETSAECR